MSDVLPGDSHVSFNDLKTKLKDRFEKQITVVAQGGIKFFF